MGGISLEFFDIGWVGFVCIDGIVVEGVNDFEVMMEYVWVLVIFFGDVLLKWGGEWELYGFLEGEW